MSEARAIFQNIYLGEATTEEKVDAIKKVVGMETHNSFTKQEFINALDWLLNEHSKYNGWIPCSEKLPSEKDGSVIICNEKGEINIGKHSEHNMTWYIGDMHSVGGAEVV